MQQFAGMAKMVQQMKPDREQMEAFNKALPAWERTFLTMLRSAERNAGRGPRKALDEVPSNQTPANERGARAEESDAGSAASAPSGVAALRGRGKATAGPGGRRIVSGKKGHKGEPERPEEPAPAPKRGPEQKMRKWGSENQPLDAGDMASLDYSGAAADDGAGGAGGLDAWIDKSKLGSVREDGTYELADDDPAQADEEAEAEAEASSAGLFGRLRTTASGFSLSRLTGARDALTRDDLAPVVQAMQAHLQSKNVAADVAEMICSGVQQRLLGKRVPNFGSVKNEVRRALEEAIARVLTPSSSTDILLEIASKKQRRDELLATLPAHATRANQRGAVSPALNPYALCFVGVNGVGKSTNLAKVCFWLLQNRYRVLIAACDTFRSGAVEQLRTHVRNLGQLEIDGQRVSEKLPDGGSRLELYERGYGKDAAGIAKDALAYARTNGFDVVLIDTAGRMQDNEPLMRALAKLIAVNQPDKVVFVGEALVGNEAVDQLTKFNRALKDYSGVSDPRGLDGCLLTKWDTVDDKVGTALTFTSSTGLPIYFVGTGQTYTDLRQLRVHHVVNALLRA